MQRTDQQSSRLAQPAPVERGGFDQAEPRGGSGRSATPRPDAHSNRYADDVAPGAGRQIAAANPKGRSRAPRTNRQNRTAPGCSPAPWRDRHGRIADNEMTAIGGDARPDQRVPPSLARQQYQQHQRVIFEKTGDQIERVAAEPPRRRRAAERAAAHDQQEDGEIAIGAFERVDRHRRQRGRGREDQRFVRIWPGGSGRISDRMSIRSRPSPTDGRRCRVEKAWGEHEPQRRIDMHAAERVARVREVDVDPEPLTLGGGEDGVDVEKRKAERFKTRTASATSK